MNSIVKAAALARRGVAGPKARDAEAYYQMARNVFGVESVEAKVAWGHWHVLRGDARGNMR